jgi:potassium-transporting ATPase KdpC subunit
MNTQVQLKQIIRPAIVSLMVFTIITGILYPALITGIAQVFFPHQANGSLIRDKEGNVIGSELIGQQFSTPEYFWGRPSVTTSVPYNAAASSGSNYGPLNPALIGQEGIVQTRIRALHDADAAAGVTNSALIPVDLVTASGSGLDPQISLAAAQYQVARVASLRGVDVAKIQTLVNEYTEERTIGLLGESRVNVLKLNIALDELYPLSKPSQ